MTERVSDRWVSIVLSVLLHGTLVAALVYGFWAYRQSRPPTPTLAIEATVVDPRSLPGALRTPPPPPAPPVVTPPPEAEPVEPTGPPEPTPEELAQREQAAKDQAQKEQAAQEAEKQRQLEQQKQQEEAQRQAEEKKQQEAQAKAEADRKAEAERKAAEAKKRAEEQRLAEQKRADAAQRQADEKARAEREADLKSDLAAEERTTSARNSGALASYEALIAARIKRAWLQPPSARPGIECVLHVTQVPGGAVASVSLGTCNGDAAVRESLVAAAYRASPLPPPPDPSLFERNLDITFKPD